MPITLEETREKQIDAVLKTEKAARDAEARAALRVQLIEKERIAREAQEQAVQSAARAAYLERAEAAYLQACAEYKTAVDAFREKQLRLWALDEILGRSGGFSDHHLGVALRHARAADDETDLHHGFRAAVDSMRRTLGG